MRRNLEKLGKKGFGVMLKVELDILCQVLSDKSLIVWLHNYSTLKCFQSTKKEKVEGGKVSLVGDGLIYLFYTFISIWFEYICLKYRGRKGVFGGLIYFFNTFISIFYEYVL